MILVYQNDRSCTDKNDDITLYQNSFKSVVYEIESSTIVFNRNNSKTDKLGEEIGCSASETT